MPLQYRERVFDRCVYCPILPTHREWSHSGNKLHRRGRCVMLLNAAVPADGRKNAGKRDKQMRGSLSWWCFDSRLLWFPSIIWQRRHPRRKGHLPHLLLRLCRDRDRGRQRHDTDMTSNGVNPFHELSHAHSEFTSAYNWGPCAYLCVEHARMANHYALWQW